MRTSDKMPIGQMLREIRAEFGAHEPLMHMDGLLRRLLREGIIAIVYETRQFRYLYNWTPKGIQITNDLIHRIYSDVDCRMTSYPWPRPPVRGN